MKCEKTKLINFDNFNDHIEFSREIIYENILSNSDDVKEDFSTPDTIWIVHELKHLSLIKNVAAGSVVVAVIQDDLLKSNSIRLPFDLIKYFNDEKVSIVFGGGIEEQARVCSTLIDIDRFLCWRQFIREDTIEKRVLHFGEFYRSLGAMINIKSLYKNTNIHATHIFLRNSLINAPLAHNRIDISKFAGALANKPFLIVAAGPSLNKQLPLLSKHQENFNILAVDTVWPILEEYGIIPDLVFALDARSKPSWPKNGIANQTCLSVDIGCAPKLVWSHDQNHLFSSTSEQIRRLLEFLGVQIDILPTGGSVATSAFDFARFLGGNPIVLIGQDLALTGGKDHADGYLHVYSNDFLKARVEAGFDVEGYYGDRVKTEKQLLYYKTWYEDQVKKYPEVMVINSTEGGAKIKGCLQVPFEAVCSELKMANIDKKFIFPKYQMWFNPEHLVKLNENIDRLIENVQGFIGLAKKGEILIGSKAPRSLTKLLKKIDKINGDIMSYDENARFVVDTFSQLQMDIIRFQTITDKTEKNIDTAVDKYKQIYVGIQESGHMGLAMLGQIQILYRRLSECQVYDSSLLDEIITDIFRSPTV